MHDLDQQPHVEVNIHEHQQYQEDRTTPVISRLSYLTAQTWEQHQQHQHQPQTQQTAHHLERRAAAQQHQTRLQLVLWMARGIAPMVVILRAGPDQQLLLACVRLHAHTSAEQHHGLLTHRRVHLRPATGPALTLPRHCELSAADGTTSA